MNWDRFITDEKWGRDRRVNTAGRDRRVNTYAASKQQRRTPALRGAREFQCGYGWEIQARDGSECTNGSQELLRRSYGFYPQQHTWRTWSHACEGGSSGQQENRKQRFEGQPEEPGGDGAGSKVRQAVRLRNKPERGRENRDPST